MSFSSLRLSQCGQRGGSVAVFINNSLTRPQFSHRYSNKGMRFLQFVTLNPVTFDVGFGGRFQFPIFKLGDDIRHRAVSAGHDLNAGLLQDLKGFGPAMAGN
jgi:hypothetical protein